jgi:hypothetical protein
MCTSVLYVYYVVNFFYHIGHIGIIVSHSGGIKVIYYQLIGTGLYLPMI